MGAAPSGRPGWPEFAACTACDGEDAQGIDGFGSELSVERGESDGGQENLLERGA